ncbi:MAG: hypothetical protein ACYCST_01565 [Acidimicrobiales bacterium]
MGDFAAVAPVDDEVVRISHFSGRPVATLVIGAVECSHEKPAEGGDRDVQHEVQAK